MQVQYQYTTYSTVLLSVWKLFKVTNISIYLTLISLC